jgi:hypothetical protein
VLETTKPISFKHIDHAAILATCISPFCHDKIPCQVNQSAFGLGKIFKEPQVASNDRTLELCKVLCTSNLVLKSLISTCSTISI